MGTQISFKGASYSSFEKENESRQDKNLNFAINKFNLNDVSKNKHNQNISIIS